MATSSTPVPSVALPTIPTSTPTTSAASVPPLPTSNTSTSPTPVTPTTSPVSTSTVSNPSSSSSSSSGSSSVPSSTTSSSSGTTSSTSSTTSFTSLPSSSSSTISYVLQTSDGQVFTLTSVVTESSEPTQAPKSSSSSSNNGFIHNKAAVAGVFTVVGICTVVLAFFLFTSYLRRRRARDFDREIEEAAAAAATAKPPDFDEYDYGSAGGYGHYSETSHGTLSQLPLSHDQSRSQDGSYDAYASVGVSGAAGIGTRGRSVRNGGQQDPYAALSNPPEQYEMHETGRGWQQGTPLAGPGGTNFDILQAAGLSSSDPYAVARGPSMRAPLASGQSQHGTSGPMRSQSQGASTLPTTAEGYPMPVPTPAPVYSGAQDMAHVPNEKARNSASYAPGVGASTMPPDVAEDAYDGYQEQSFAALANPHSPGFAAPRASEDVDEEQNARAPYSQEREEAARESLADDEDYGYTVGQRVLRVANE